MYENLVKIQDLDLKNKTVVVRANYDVQVQNDEIIDTTPIQASVKTIEHLLQNNCKIVLISHLGSPNGEVDDGLSLMPVRFELGRILNKPIKFAHIHACENSIKFMEQGEILLLENVKFHTEEESEDIKVRKQFVEVLGKLADVYVYDAFGVEGQLASINDLAKMSKIAAAGFSTQKEIENITRLIKKSESPFVSILGGEASEEKFAALNKLVTLSDTILFGGEIANAFLKAQKVSIGKNEISTEQVKMAKEIIEVAKAKGCEIVLPVDHLGAKEMSESAEILEINTQQIPDNLFTLDLGPRTLLNYREIIEAAKTVFWFGVMGEFKWENANKGTEAIGEYIALSTPKDCFKFAGGSETTLAMNLLKIKQKRFTHTSIGDKMLLKVLSGEKFRILDQISK